jgi:Tfp pilus assembly protein PilF
LRPVEPPQAGDAARAGVFVAKGRAALRGFDRTTARKMFDAALAADPACVDAHELLGWFLLDATSEQDAGAALLCFERLRALGRSGASIDAGEGVARALCGESTGAQRLLESARSAPELAAEPSRLAKVLIALGRLACQSGDDVAAEHDFKTAAEVEPAVAWRAEPLAQLGELQARIGRTAEAEQTLRAAIAADADHLKARYLLSRLLLKSGRTDEAEREARVHELLRQLYDPQSQRITGDMERRIRLRAELVAAAPDCAAFKSSWLRALVDAKRYADCEKALADLVKRQPATAELAYLLARARAGRGNLEGADQARALLHQLDPAAPASLDREIADEWRRGVPDVSDDAYEALLARWGRGRR